MTTPAEIKSQYLGKPAAGNWQDMETAPKDGTFILLLWSWRGEIKKSYVRWDLRYPGWERASWDVVCPEDAILWALI